MGCYSDAFVQVRTQKRGKVIESPGLAMTLSNDAKLVTFINVFTVEPANQQRLVDLLAHATVASVRHAPGFVSATLHRSLDGTKVTMYAQWRTIEDYQAMRNNPASSDHLQEALAIAKFEPGMYEIVESYLPDDKGTRDGRDGPSSID